MRRVQVAVTSVAPQECLLMQQTPLPGVFRCVARYGFNDKVLIQLLCLAACAGNMTKPCAGLLTWL